MRERFPNIGRICSMYGLDIASDRIPVRPAVHYFMGGVKVDLNGRTDIGRLFAVGECASTGVHGANRLASNSLLEGLVFGDKAGRIAMSSPEGQMAQDYPGASFFTGHRPAGSQRYVPVSQSSHLAQPWRIS